MSICHPSVQDNMQKYTMVTKEQNQIVIHKRKNVLSILGVWNVAWRPASAALDKGEVLRGNIQLQCTGWALPDVPRGSGPRLSSLCFCSCSPVVSEVLWSQALVTAAKVDLCLTYWEVLSKFILHWKEKKRFCKDSVWSVNMGACITP